MLNSNMLYLNIMYINTIKVPEPVSSLWRAVVFLTIQLKSYLSHWVWTCRQIRGFMWHNSPSSWKDKHIKKSGVTNDVFSAMCSSMKHRRSMVLCLHLIKMFSEELNQARSLIVRRSWCVFKCCEKTQI